MTSTDDTSLVERRRRLRMQLHAQREVIEHQLDPVRDINSGYPRSMTMRFLTEHSTLAGGLFTGAATLLVGARYFKSIAAALTVIKLVRSATTNRQR